MVQIKEVSSKKDMKQFVSFQFDLYKNDKFWIPPIIKDELKQLDPKANPAFDFCDTKFWTAWKDNKCVGRMGAIINHDYNTKVGEKLGRFSKVEFVDDVEVSGELFRVAEAWLKQQGMKKIHGPLGFSNLDTQGMLIEGFDFLPSIGSVYHKSYYKKHLDDLGFGKENDWVEFRLTLGEKAVNKGIRGAKLIKRRYGFEVVRFSTKAELKPYIKPLFQILNDAFQELPYVTKFNDKMIELYAEKYLKVLNPKYVRVVKKDSDIVAFVIALPTLSEAMQKANGKLFPFGFYHILQALKQPKWLDLLLTGAVHEHQNSGTAVILFAEIQEEMMKQGITIMETTGIFETNHNVISNWKNYEHIQHKRRRCFIKEIN